MSIKSITISGYRGYATTQTARFALPMQVPGSGLTVIVGSNSSGKSSLLEALGYCRYFAKVVKLVPGQKNMKTNGHIRLTYELLQGQMLLETGAGGFLGWVGPIPDPPVPASLYSVPPRRSLPSLIRFEPLSRVNYISNDLDFGSRQQGEGQFAGRIAAMDSRKAEVADLLKRVFPSPPTWFLDQDNQGQHRMRVTSATSAHDSEGLGSGTSSVIHLVDALYDSTPGSIIVLDEPELSLHPAAQRRLLEILVEFSADRQVILATHSPFLTPLDLMAKGMEVIRVSHDENGSKIHQVQRNTAQAMQGVFEDRHNPHVLGLNAREVLFLEEDVILVEGQDDVLAYRDLLSRLQAPISASFFGWGVGGASKMQNVVELLNDLGFKRVFGLLDAGELEIAAALQSKYPGYRFECIPAEDVRDKLPRTATNGRTGLIGADGAVKAQYHEQMEGIFSMLGLYFRGTP